jgi:hypothetical protein
MFIPEISAAQTKQCREELLIQFFLAPPVIPDATVYDLLFNNLIQAVDL